VDLRFRARHRVETAESGADLFRDETKISGIGEGGGRNGVKEDFVFAEPFQGQPFNVVAHVLIHRGVHHDDVRACAGTIQVVAATGWAVQQMAAFPAQISDETRRSRVAIE
jgi:hypothetical protein